MLPLVGLAAFALGGGASGTALADATGSGGSTSMVGTSIGASSGVAGASAGADAQPARTTMGVSVAMRMRTALPAVRGNVEAAGHRSNGATLERCAQGFLGGAFFVTRPGANVIG